MLPKQFSWLLGTTLDRSPLRRRIPASWYSFCRPQRDDRLSTPPGINSTGKQDLNSGTKDPKPTTLAIKPTPGNNLGWRSSMSHKRSWSSLQTYLELHTQPGTPLCSSNSQPMESKATSTQGLLTSSTLVANTCLPTESFNSSLCQGWSAPRQCVGPSPILHQHSLTLQKILIICLLMTPPYTVASFREKSSSLFPLFRH